MTDFEGRRRRLMEAINAEAFLVVHLEGTDPDRASMQYLSGYAGFGVLLVASDDTHAYASPTNIGMASEEAPHLDWQLLDWDYQNAIVALLEKHGYGRVALASRRIGMLTWQALSDADVCTLVVESDPVAAIRAVKDADEIDAIRHATKITEASLHAVVSSLHEGQTEREIAWQLEREMRDRGADGIAFELIVSRAASSALPHHNPSDEPFRRGDVVLFDIGARFHGYCSDITRVVSVGRPPQLLEEIYGIVLEANQAGIDAFAPGASGETVNDAARDVIEKAGYGDYYPHGLSHGVGLEVHELPVSEGARAVSSYLPGNVCTAEPGIYIPDVGGIRIEDLLVVTVSACDVLSCFPKDRLTRVG